MRNIVLIGMPGSGKSEVGRRVAERLGWLFLDTDLLVEKRTGASIADLFAQRGELEFRKIERDIVREAAKARPAVIATGGGVVLDDGNMDALRRSGLVVSLHAAPDVLLARVGNERRPLLAVDAPSSLERLFRERAPRYAEADLVVDAGRGPEQLTEEIILTLAERGTESVRVELAERSYEIRIGEGILDVVGWDIFRRLRPSRAVLITHPRLHRRFGGRVEGILRALGLVPLVVKVPKGEGSKSLACASAVMDRMAAEAIDRSAVVIGLGGGVVGDLAGFVAGVYMRGLALIHIPTTLLAQVDSAIGGKAAVNHPRAKNLMGVFHQPALVLADVETLLELPDREVRSGLAEVIKYAMVCDADFLAWIEDNLERLLARDLDALRTCVRRCAALKARIVAEDERERNARRLLNYGHTVGHALERRMGTRLTHGEAIAHGMSVEVRVARELGLVGDRVVQRQDEILRRTGLPVGLPHDGPPAQGLLETMRLDKKVRGGELRLTLLKEVGEGLIDIPVPEPVLRAALAQAR